MIKVCIIGSSEIVYHHIKAMLKNNIQLYSICSTRKNSVNSINLKKKFNIQHHYDDWKECINKSIKEKNIFFLVCPRIKDTFKIVLYLAQRKQKIFSEKPLSLKINELKKLIKFNKQIFIGYNRIFYKSLNDWKDNLIVWISYLRQFAVESNLDKLGIQWIKFIQDLSQFNKILGIKNIN